MQQLPKQSYQLPTLVGRERLGKVVIRFTVDSFHLSVPVLEGQGGSLEGR